LLSPARAGLFSALPFLSSIPAVLILPRYTRADFRDAMIGLLAILAGADRLTPVRLLAAALIFTGVFLSTRKPGWYRKKRTPG